MPPSKAHPLSEGQPIVSEPEAAPFLFILKNGPIHGIDDYIGNQLEVLSRELRGELWVTGSFDADQEIGRFRARVVKEPERKNLAFFVRYYSRVIRRARQLHTTLSGPKVIITYDPFRNGLLGRLLHGLLGWPLIVEINGAYGDPEIFADADGIFATRIKPRLFKLIGRYVLRHANGIRLLFNEQLAGFARLPPGAVVRQYFDCVPLERFPPAPPENFVLSVGYPFHLKGIDILLQAYERVHAEFPHWRLILIGHDLARHIQPVPAYATVIRGIPNTELATWMRRCGILVLASRSEAMGRVLLEAAAAAKPRIAAAVGGTYTVLSDELDGLLFPKADVAALEGALRRLMSDAGLREKLGKAARTRTLAQFGGDNYVKHVTGLVHAVLRQES
jgi:glycosyltransferase involved in cell wall biosynthesis